MVTSCSANRFRRVVEPTALAGFARLTTLSLNQTLVSWPEVVYLAPSLGQLRHLELGHNRLATVTPPDGLPEGASQLVSLEELNLSGNQLADWDQTTAELDKLPAYVQPIK